MREGCVRGGRLGGSYHEWIRMTCGVFSAARILSSWRQVRQVCQIFQVRPTRHVRHVWQAWHVDKFHVDKFDKFHNLDMLRTQGNVTSRSSLHPTAGTDSWPSASRSARSALGTRPDRRGRHIVVVNFRGRTWHRGSTSKSLGAALRGPKSSPEPSGKLPSRARGERWASNVPIHTVCLLRSVDNYGHIALVSRINFESNTYLSLTFCSIASRVSLWPLGVAPAVESSRQIS